jgi:5-methylcytosine-specific restriction protein B
MEDIVNGEAIPSGDIHYWWLVANPKIWSMVDMAVGTKVEYSLYNDNDKPRRIAQNFLDAKVGDKVIGYESTPTKQVVALLEVSRANDGKTIEYTKTKSLERPVDYSSFKDLPELASMQFLQNPQGSFFALTQAEYEDVIEMIDDDNPIRTTSKEEPEIYDKEDFLSEVYMKEEDYDSLLYLLKTKKNIILQGAPGVGKTFSAKRLAYSMMGMKDEERVEVVQFHQNYTYEDFIMGYKPTEDGGFKLMNGIFYRFCKKAESDPEREYFFIIDEINRGNLSKVFGELMMLIENGYRGKSIKLAYTNELFSVPENIYLIGMMNTADRSLAMIDYALRRRFSFFDMKPGFDSEGFKDYQKDLNNETLDRFIQAIESLNDTIAKDDSLGTGFCIGHSYFCEQKSFDKQWLENVLNYDIAPMLREYWFDDATKANNQIEELRKILK